MYSMINYMEKSKSFYMEENRRKSEWGERKREKGSRMCEVVLHKKGSASVINSSVGRIPE
jgi:hypothetical protein